MLEQLLRFYAMVTPAWDDSFLICLLRHQLYLIRKENAHEKLSYGT